MVYDHIYLIEAEGDVEQALEFYDNINIELSQDLVLKLESIVLQIKKNPLLFQKIKGKYRKANLDRFPYQIIYSIRKHTIIIIALAHHKQKPNFWRSRKP